MTSANTGIASSLVIATVLILAAPPAPAQESWTDSLSFSGDFRPRYEYIDLEDVHDRSRERFRLRLGLTTRVNDKVEFGFRLATGGDNPVSTNQSFDGGFTRKDIGLDLAYADWTVNEDLHLVVGKMKNPMHRAGSHALIWDSDLNPEGVAATYASGALFGTAGVYFVEERALTDDTMLLAAQGGMDFDVSSTGSLKVGLGYYDYTEMQGNFPLWIGLPFGNSVGDDLRLLYDYKQVEAFTEYATTVGEMPLRLFANYVTNTEVDENDEGYAFGVQIGRAGKPGTWQASWAWQELQADAVVATFTDSDFGGGGTDARGHTIKGRYALRDNWALAATLFINEVGLASGSPRDYRRLQLDLEFRFGS